MQLKLAAGLRKYKDSLKQLALIICIINFHVLLLLIDMYMRNAFMKMSN